MPLAAPALAALIKSNITSASLFPSASEDQLDAMCLALATAVVTHIQSAAILVNATVTTGPGSGGTVQGQVG